MNTSKKLSLFTNSKISIFSKSKTKIYYFSDLYFFLLKNICFLEWMLQNLIKHSEKVKGIIFHRFSPFFRTFQFSENITYYRKKFFYCWNHLSHNLFGEWPLHRKKHFIKTIWILDRTPIDNTSTGQGWDVGGMKC